MGSLSAADLLGAPIRLHGILLGKAVDLVLDSSCKRVLGFVVEGGDDVVRFLPFAASQPGRRAVAVASALMLLDDVAFYRTRGTSLRSLLGTHVVRAGRRAGTLVDMLVDQGADVVELEVELDGVRHRVEAAGSSFAAAAASAA